MPGRLQRQCLRAFIALGGEAKTSELAEWCWPEGNPTRDQVASLARAARSIGARPVRRVGPEWLWRRLKDAT
jgi:hypothetical protein